MKFRFSVKSLFILTTAISVLMGIAVWLELVSHWRVIALFGCYFLVYLSVVTLILGPGYLRDFKDYREKRAKQRFTRANLEREAQEMLKTVEANVKKSSPDSRTEPEEFQS